MSGLLEPLLEAAFPHHCYLCGQVALPRQRICSACVEKAPFILPPICPHCGRSEDACGCEGHRRHYERCISPFYHEDGVKYAVSNLKNEGYVDTVEGFAAEMAEVVRREYGGVPFSFVTAVPIHRRDLLERGFDQAKLLGKALARRLYLPYYPTMKKIARTRPQKELSALERSGNLLGVFDVTAEAAVCDKTVLLVDDVCTTGATLDECAKMLKIYGAAEVYAVTAAAAKLKKEQDG